jgi:hypothetical protein
LQANFLVQEIVFICIAMNKVFMALDIRVVVATIRVGSQGQCPRLIYNSANRIYLNVEHRPQTHSEFSPS